MPSQPLRAFQRHPTPNEEHTYDAVNHLLTVTMPRTVNSTQVTQTKDIHLQRELTVDRRDAAENGTTAYAYNADGSLHSRTDAKNQVTTYTCDSYQRVTQITHGSDASQTVKFSYDGAGPNSSAELFLYVIVINSPSSALNPTGLRMEFFDASTFY